MKKMLFIFNPHTGGGRLETSMLQVLCHLSATGYDVTVHPTKCRGDARETAKARAAGFDLVVCCGGDGTLNEVVQGLLALENPPELGYIPGGTTNDFAASLGLPRDDMLAAADRAVTPGLVYESDIGCMNDERVFTYVAAFGAFTDVSYSTPQRFKNLMGYTAYVLEGVQRLPGLESTLVEVKTESETFEADVLLGMVSNSTSVGGFTFSSEVALNDGMFELLMVRRPQSLTDMAGLVSAMVTRNTDSPYIIAKHVNKATIHAEKPIPWTLDGEFGGEMARAAIQVLPKALKIHI